MEGGAIVKVEGGQVESGAGSQAGSWPENRAGGQAGVRAGIQIGEWVDMVGGLGQGRAKPGSGVRTSKFFRVALARAPIQVQRSSGVFIKTCLSLCDR